MNEVRRQQLLQAAAGCRVKGQQLDSSDASQVPAAFKGYWKIRVPAASCQVLPVWCKQLGYDCQSGAGSFRGVLEEQGAGVGGGAGDIELHAQLAVQLVGQRPHRGPLRLPHSPRHCCLHGQLLNVRVALSHSLSYFVSDDT